MADCRVGDTITLNEAPAHEALPGNTASREAMDLYNNEVGRNIARDNPERAAYLLGATAQEPLEPGTPAWADPRRRA